MIALASGRLAVAAMAFALAAIGAPARAQDSSAVAAEFWPELNVFVKLGRDVRTYTIVTPSREFEDGKRGDLASWQVGQFIEIGLGPLVRSRAEAARRDESRLKYLRLRPGVEYVGLPGARTEWRIVTELTPRFFLPGEVLLAWRNRGEARWIDGDFSWRYRTRAWFEREFRVGRSAALVPYVSAEPFYDSRFDCVVQLRCQFGTAIPVSRRFVPEINYTWQSDDSGGDLQTTHALNLVAGFFF